MVRSTGRAEGRPRSLALVSGGRGMNIGTGPEGFSLRCTLWGTMCPRQALWNGSRGPNEGKACRGCSGPLDHPVRYQAFTLGAEPRRVVAVPRDRDRAAGLPELQVEGAATLGLAPTRRVPEGVVGDARPPRSGCQLPIGGTMRSLVCDQGSRPGRCAPVAAWSQGGNDSSVYLPATHC